MFFTACSACSMRASQPSPHAIGDSYNGLCFKCQADVTWHRQQGSRHGAAGCHCDLCWASHLEAAEMGANYGRGSRARYRRAVEARLGFWQGEAAIRQAQADEMRACLVTPTRTQWKANIYARAAARARAILEREVMG